VLAITLSCRAPEMAHTPPASAPSASSGPEAATSSDIDDDLGTRLRSVEGAEARLLATSFFTTANISLGDWPSPNVRAFNTILDSPRAAESIERLLASPGIVARLYGTCGLYFVAREKYSHELEKLSTLDGNLWFVDGCVIEELSISQVVERLRTSKITEHLRLLSRQTSSMTSTSRTVRSEDGAALLDPPRIVRDSRFDQTLAVPS
jgi:hypothetical protein